MFLKTFTTALFFISFVFTLVFHADGSMFNETECKRETVDILPGGCTRKCPAKKKSTHGSLHKLEKDMKLGIDDTSFPAHFSKYITDCMRLKEYKRAIDFFLTLAGENQTSANALTAKGVITYGWWAENVMRHGLQKIDEAISLDKKVFFPRLCRATYLSCLPDEFMAAINEFRVLLETERDNPSNLYDIYSNLARVYGEHGHYDMVAHINEKLLEVQGRLNKKINWSHANEKSSGINKHYSEIIRLSYPVMNNTIINKLASTKDMQLNDHLAILERNMERKIYDTNFGDIYTRYVILAWQYGETGRAINFFKVLAERHPESPNALAALGTITYGWRGQILLQQGLDCIESAIVIDNDNFFSRINHATFIAYFPNGFAKSMYEFSILRQTNKGLPQKLSLINNYINHICLQHGHDRIPAEYIASAIRHRL
ncbi:MAG: tetratricopeptide repeat protein [Candidatus Scalindua sp.]